MLTVFRLVAVTVAYIMQQFQFIVTRNALLFVVTSKVTSYDFQKVTN